MKALGVVLGFVIAGVAATAHADCAAPPAVKAYLAQHPGWTVLDEAALSLDDRKLWSELHAGQCPGLASADLTGSGKTAYAVAVTTAGKDGMWQVVLIGDRSVRTLRAPSRSQTVVWATPPGELVEVQTARRVTAKHPAFVLAALESSAEAFYHADGKLQSLWISD